MSSVACPSDRASELSCAVTEHHTSVQIVFSVLRVVANGVTKLAVARLSGGPEFARGIGLAILALVGVAWAVFGVTLCQAPPSRRAVVCCRPGA